ncbi:hypothetical protein ACI79C_23350 [Geodermatophilus sp. SYSU D00697]
MARQVDLREGAGNLATPERRAELRELARLVATRLPGDRTVTIARYDALTGNPALVRVSGADPAAGTVQGSQVQRALNHLRTLAPVLGLSLAQAEWMAQEPTRTSSGASAVHLQQVFLGIPVFGAAVTVRFARDGTPGDVTGRTASVPAEMPTVNPRVSVHEVFATAVRHLDDTATDGGTDGFGQPLPGPSGDLAQLLDATPEVVAHVNDRPDRGVVLQVPGRSGAAIATLVWFPIGTNWHLGWSLLLAPQLDGEGSQLVVDATDGTVLYCSGAATRS